MLTKLEAINQMLDAIGEDAVSSLEATDIEDVEAALRTFDRVNRQVQAKGWHRNTDTEYVLSRDVNNRILIPSDTLRIDSSGPHAHIDIVPRKLSGFLYVYNRDKNTFIFESDLIVDIVRLLDFESLTPELQMYITAKAASAFKTGETRIEDIKSAILASESAQNSAKIALTAADAAEISLENSIIQKI